MSGNRVHNAEGDGRCAWSRMQGRGRTVRDHTFATKTDKLARKHQWEEGARALTSPVQVHTGRH